MEGKVSSEDADAAEAPRKRAKKAQSCDQCRRRKLKCDRGWPCGACRDRNEMHMCTWENGIVPKTGARGGPESAQVLTKIASLESGIERVLRRLDDAESRWRTVSPERAAASVPRAPPSLTELDEDARGASGLFGMTWQTSSRESMIRVLARMHALMPDKHAMALLFDAYASELECYVDILSLDMLHKCKDTVRTHDAMRAQNADYLAHRAPGEVVDLIYAEALLYCAFGVAMIFSRNANLNTLYKEKDAVPAHGRFFHEAQRGLACLNVFEEPRIEFVICNLLLITGISSIRPPVVGVGLLNQASQVAMLLDLHLEPPASMPHAQAAQRVQVFRLVCIHDWFSTTTTKRYPVIRRDRARFPSLFGSQQEQSKYLSPYQQFKLRISELYCRSALLDMQAGENYTDVVSLHRDIVDLQEHSPKQESPVYETSDLHAVSVKVSSAALHYLLLRIHLPYYARGWDDPRYQLSRETCYASSRALLRIFREAFSWKVTPGTDTEGQPPKHISLISQMWNFCNWSTAATLLLLKHVTVLSARETAPSWDPERESIVQDLCIMSRLLHYLSPASTVACEGYEAMQLVAQHILRTSFDTRRGADDNCVTHWASRIIQQSTQPAERISEAEPMSLLSNIMKISEVTAECGTSVTTPAQGVAPVPSTYVEATSDDLDTFWSQFAAPDLDVVPPALMRGTLAEEILGSGHQDYDWSADMGASNSTIVAQQKDRLFPSQFQYPVGMLDQMTDEMLKSFETYSPRLVPGAPSNDPIP